MLLEPNNVKAWAGTFIRRDATADPVPIEEIAQRYLKDTGSDPLAHEASAMEALCATMAEAMMQMWGVVVDDNGMAQGATCLEPLRLGGKVCLTIPSATILNSASGFNEKDLTTRG